MSESDSKRNWSKLIKEDRTSNGAMLIWLVLVWFNSFIRHPFDSDRRNLFQVFSGLSIRDRETE